MLKPLPIGIATFKDIIAGEFLYVDKTEYVYELVRYPKGVYFLSRPRRFGKSLLLSTLHEVFAGHRDLFVGLWLYDSDYQWEEHPVIRLDFSNLKVTTAVALKRGLKRLLRHAARLHDITLEDGEYYEQFFDLIFQLTVKYEKQVVVLIDEYDKPLIDNLTDVAEARRIRDVLKGFYTILKGTDEYLRFVFLTGVSKFSKVGVFSDLNNLDDLTMSPLFATLLGITEEELSSYFDEYLMDFAPQQGMAKAALLRQVRHWYNGFRFAANCPSVYNPFSLLKLFKHRHFSNYWFETGTPTFLIQLIRERRYNVAELEDLRVRELSFSSYDIDNLSVLPLLFQTGYLTIKGYDPESRLYQLYYPNTEVEESFLLYLMNEFGELEKGMPDAYLWRLAETLAARDFEAFFTVLRVLLANIPYEIHIEREKYYQSIFYLIFKLIGLQIDAEVRTNRGRIDAVVETEEAVFLFEFKLDGSAEEALAQIKARGYAEKYGLREAVYLVGVNFGTQERGVVEWLVEEGAGADTPH